MLKRGTFIASAGTAALALLPARGSCSVPDELETVGPKLPPAPFRIAPTSSKFNYRGSGEFPSEIEMVIGSIEFPIVNFTFNGDSAQSFVICDALPETVPGPERVKLARIWPLEYGKSVSYTRREGAGQTVRAWVDELSVIGTRTLDLGDLKLDTYLIRWRTETAAAMGSHDTYDVRGHWKESRIYWFAPSLGWVVALLVDYEFSGTHRPSSGHNREYRIRSWQLAKRTSD